MTRILRQLQGRGHVPFVELFELDINVSYVVVNFIAILELAKEGLISITQDAPYQPIYVRLGREDASSE
jgi:segregation and condensation protein A